MVKNIKILFAFLRLIRLSNLLIIIVTQYFIRWFILRPLLAVTGFDLQLTEFDFALLVLATVLIAAAGYIINDYFDRKADLVNRPGKVVVGRLIRRRAAMILHIVLTFLGILAGAILTYKIHKFSLLLIFIFTGGILWFYSTTYKKQLIIGNVIVSVLVGMVPLLVLLFEFPLLIDKYKLYILISGVDFRYLIFWIGSYAVFAFLISIIREIVKDMEDFEGDYVFGRKTIPIVWGMKISRFIVLGFILITVCTLLFIMLFILNDRISFYYILAFILFPLAVIGTGLFFSSSKKNYHFLSRLTKMIMITGLLYCPIVYYIIFSMIR